MNTPSNTLPDPSAPPPPAPALLARTRPMYWSLRRELWENRSIYIAPLVTAAVVLLGFLISAAKLPARVRALAALDPAQQRAALETPYDIAGILIVVISILVGVFYCLDALHGERRDRSILFWKSLPVSDLTTVLSKTLVPLVILPLTALAVIVPLQLIMLLLSTAILAANGVSAAALWSLPFFQWALVLLYGLAVLALWYAPIYGWLLLVSGWARRVTFLWAVLPPLGLCVLEKIAFDTTHFGSLLTYRLWGSYSEAFTLRAPHRASLDALTQLDPLKFLGSPGLWTGLIVAGAFFAASVWLRRNREPI
jgi:ABC-2 type transport system permease protein